MVWVFLWFIIGLLLAMHAGRRIRADCKRHHLPIELGDRFLVLATIPLWPLLYPIISLDTMDEDGPPGIFTKIFFGKEKKSGI